MKIPQGKNFSIFAENKWEEAAAQIGLEAGILVEVGKDYDDPGMNGFPVGNIGGNLAYASCSNQIYIARLIRVYFKVEGHEFETLTELKKAISMKAFL